MPREVNVVALVKGSEQYVYIYDENDAQPLVDVFEDHAADSRLSLSWFDVAVLCQQVSDQIEESVEPSNLDPDNDPFDRAMPTPD